MLEWKEGSFWLDGCTISSPLSRTHTQRTMFYRIYISFVRIYFHIETPASTQSASSVHCRRNTSGHVIVIDRTEQQNYNNKNASTKMLLASLYTLVIISIFLLHSIYKMYKAHCCLSSIHCM